MNWPLIALIAAGYAAAGLLGALAQIGSTKRRRTGSRPAAGAGHAPVPGTGPGHPGGQRNPPPARPSPAPGYQTCDLCGDTGWVTYAGPGGYAQFDRCPGGCLVPQYDPGGEVT